MRRSERQSRKHDTEQPTDSGASDIPFLLLAVLIYVVISANFESKFTVAEVKPDAIAQTTYEQLTYDCKVIVTAHEDGAVEVGLDGRPPMTRVACAFDDPSSDLRTCATEDWKLLKGPVARAIQACGERRTEVHLRHHRRAWNQVMKASRDAAGTVAGSLPRVDLYEDDRPLDRT